MKETNRVTVLFVNPFSYEHKLGGMDTLLLDILRNMDSQQFRRIVILPRRGGIEYRYNAVADKVLYLDSKPITRLKSPLTLVVTLIKIPFSAYRLYKIIRQTGAQIVHTQTELVYSSGLATRWAKVASVYMVQSSPYKSGEEWIWDVIVRLLDKLADRILVVSKDVHAEFLRRSVSSEKLSLIYNGIDTTYFKPVETAVRDQIRAEFLTGDQKYIVGMMGRLHVSKGIETFLQAAALIRREHSDVHFVIVGTIVHPKHAPYEKQLKQLATQLGLDDCLTFAGFRDDVPQVLSSFDVFLFPSLREPFGLALAEAMAMELAVVASNSGGVPEIVTSGVTGQLVSPDDPTGFAHATLELLANPARRKKIGQAARKHIETAFSVEKQAQAVEAVYDALLKNNSNK